MFFLAPLYRLFKDINEERIDIRNSVGCKCEFAYQVNPAASFRT